MATPRVTIDQLPEQAAAEDTNYVIVQDAGITKKMSMATLKNVTSNPLATHIGAAADAHDASAISTTPAGTGVDGASVQVQLGQLATLVDALPTQAESDTRYVNVTGDTMVGPLYASGAPVIDLEVATKKYVDDSIIASTPGITEAEADVRYVNITGDTMSGALSVEGGLSAGSLPITNVGQAVASTDAVNKGQADSLYVNLAGDTMSGTLTMSGASTQIHLPNGPTLDEHATRKVYVDSMLGLRVAKAGDTMTGALTLPASDPTNANHAARKAYVDRRVAFRWQRSAWNCPAGTDPAPGGTLSTQENIGGWVGVGSVANPLVVPETGTYALMGLVNGGSFSGSSAIIFEIGGVYFIVPFQPGTTAYTGGSLVMYLLEGALITWRIRNASGTTVNNVSFTAEATKLA